MLRALKADKPRKFKDTQTVRRSGCGEYAVAAM
jgi:hypothetical protein